MIEHTIDLSIRHAQIEIEMNTRKMKIAFDIAEEKHWTKQADEIRKIIDAELLAEIRKQIP